MDDSRVQTCQVFIYKYETRKDGSLNWVPNDPEFGGSDLVQVGQKQGKSSPAGVDFRSPNGWKFSGPWRISKEAGVESDETGWQYSYFKGDIESTDITDWCPAMNVKHRLRRQKLICDLSIDPEVSREILIEEEVFHEYSNQYWGDYHTFSKPGYIFRRKIWFRKLSGEQNFHGNERIAQLDGSVMLYGDSKKEVKVVSRLCHFLDISKVKKSMSLHAYIYQGQVIFSNSEPFDLSIVCFNFWSLKGYIFRKME